MPPNYYEVLGVPRSATRQQIRDAYRHLIVKYHPDRNPDPRAAEFTRRLNEAYSVLSDDAKRRLHDTCLGAAPAGPSGSQQESRAKPQSEDLPDVVCAHCGRKDSTLRLTLMYYVVSVLVVTYRRGASAIWCERCRAMESAKWTLLSGLLGWWGFPWGPIYTLQALFVNAKGGFQPKPNNAALLRLVAYQLYQRGRYEEAKAALQESLRLENNEEAAAFHQHLAAQAPSSSVQSPNWWKVATAAPALVIVLAWAYVIYAVANQPRGYATHYEPPPGMGSPPRAGTAVQTPRQRTNALVGELASVVAARAPIVGSHNEGTTRITDHVLDRSKFDARPLHSIADRVETELRNTAGDADGFIASAYFNAKLFALSVDIVNGVEAGADVNEQAEAVELVAADDRVLPWLQKSRFWDHYRTLRQRLRRYRMGPVAATPTAELETALKGTEARLSALKKQLDFYEASQDATAHNLLVPAYNALVREHRATAAALRSRAAASQKLDLAFNRCIDPGILLGRFHRVDLTSHQREIEALPEAK